MIPVRLVAAIDSARAGGKSHGEIVQMLRKAGVKDVERVLDMYGNLSMPDGRLRGEINPGDPADPVHSAIPERP